jgi:hypothetical protein
VASAGISLPVVPDPVNLFQNSGPRPDGRLVVGTAASLPGQFVSFLALRDLVFVLTACSVDYPPLNNGRCSPLRIEIAPSGGPLARSEALERGRHQRAASADEPGPDP